MATAKLLAMAALCILCLSLLPCDAGAHRFLRSPPPPPPPPPPAILIAPAAAPLLPPLPFPALSTIPLPPPDSNGSRFHITMFIVVAASFGGAVASGVLGYLAIQTTGCSAPCAHVFEISALALFQRHATRYLEGTESLSEAITALGGAATYQMVLAPGIFFDLVKKGHNGVKMAELLSGLASCSPAFSRELGDLLLSLDLEKLECEASAINQGEFFGNLYETKCLPLSSLSHIHLSADAVEKNAFLMSFIKAFFKRVTVIHDPVPVILEAMCHFFEGDTDVHFRVWDELIRECRNTKTGTQLLFLAMHCEGRINRDFFSGLIDMVSQDT